MPFVTSWMGENHFAALPVSLYGVVLFFAAIAFTILARMLIKHHGKDSDLAKAMGRAWKEDKKGNVSMLAYLVAIPAAFLDTRISGALYVAVAILWLVPDRRIERVMVGKEGEGD